MRSVMTDLKDFILQDAVIMTSRKPVPDLAFEIEDEDTLTKEKINQQESVPCLFLDLKEWSKFWQFVILSTSVFFFYLVSRLGQSTLKKYLSTIPVLKIT